MLCQVLRIFCILNLHFKNPSLAPLQPVLSADLILEMGSLWLVESVTQSSLWFRSICALSHFMRSLKILHKMCLLMKYASCLLPYNLFSCIYLSVKLLSIAISERKIESMACEFGLDLFETCYHSLYNLSSPYLAQSYECHRFINHGIIFVILIKCLT